ncbi:MAG: hypothetical protein RLZZ119_1216, partial [Pseudomonadota bacterium]
MSVKLRWYLFRFYASVFIVLGLRQKAIEIFDQML